MSLKENKTAAMEMSVGTIVTIVLLMSVLVLGLILISNIFTGSTDNVNAINDQVKTQINDLFGSSGDKLVVNLGSQNTAKIKQGTENFGIPMGFAPDDPAAWGANLDNCVYSLTAVNQPTYCINKGWSSVQNAIITGVSNVPFDQVDGTNGYALIKISVPDTAPKGCLQRFNIRVSCNGYTQETTTGYFDIEVVKKGIGK